MIIRDTILRYTTVTYQGSVPPLPVMEIQGISCFPEEERHIGAKRRTCTRDLHNLGKPILKRGEPMLNIVTSLDPFFIKSATTTTMSALRILVPVKRVIDYAVRNLLSKILSTSIA